MNTGRSERGTVLAIDWGKRRLGIAVGELELRTCHPLCTLQRKREGQELEQLAPLVAQWRPVLLVVGLPVANDGALHPLAPRCRAFAHKLRGAFGLPVELVDERYSSTQADSLLKDTGAGWKQRKDSLDAVAAQQILESFFERDIARP